MQDIPVSVSRVIPGAEFPDFSVELASGQLVEVAAGTRCYLSPTAHDWHALNIFPAGQPSLVAAVPFALLADLLPYFPAKGTALKVTLEHDRLTVASSTGCHVFPRPLLLTIGQDLDGQQPDCLKLTSEGGRLVGMFDLPAGSAAAAEAWAVFGRERVES